MFSWDKVIKRSFVLCCFEKYLVLTVDRCSLLNVSSFVINLQVRRGPNENHYKRKHNLSKPGLEPLYSLQDLSILSTIFRLIRKDSTPAEQKKKEETILWSSLDWIINIRSEGEDGPIWKWYRQTGSRWTAVRQVIFSNTIRQLAGCQ